MAEICRHVEIFLCPVGKVTSWLICHFIYIDVSCDVNLRRERDHSENSSFSIRKTLRKYESSIEMKGFR